jgi:hypothetical protein
VQDVARATEVVPPGQGMQKVSPPCNPENLPGGHSSQVGSITSTWALLNLRKRIRPKPAGQGAGRVRSSVSPAVIGENRYGQKLKVQVAAVDTSNQSQI